MLSRRSKMSFGHIQHVPQVRSYLSAVMLESKIKPIRGRDTSTKPLAGRRQDQLTIRKDADNIVIRLYQTDIITFKPSGEIEIFLSNFGLTRTTISTISSVLGWHYARLVDDNIWYKGQKLHSDKVNIFKDGVLQNPASIDVFKLNKKVFTQINRKYKEFRAYFKTIEKLGEGWGVGNYLSIPDFIRNASGELGIEGFYEAGASLIRSSGLRTLLDRIKYHHRDEVYTCTTQFTPPSLSERRNYKIYRGEVK